MTEVKPALGGIDLRPRLSFRCYFMSPSTAIATVAGGSGLTASFTAAVRQGGRGRQHDPVEQRVEPPWLDAHPIRKSTSASSVATSRRDSMRVSRQTESALDRDPVSTPATRTTNSFRKDPNRADS
jgi:hypothetical protein